MATPTKCPICLNANGGAFRVLSESAGHYSVDCGICGRFAVTWEAYVDRLEPGAFRGEALTPVVRSRLSHRLRSAEDTASDGLISLNRESIDRFIADGAPGPNPAEQARNIVRFIGDTVSATGEAIEDLPEHFFASVGSPNPTFAYHVIMDLRRQGLVTGLPVDVNEQLSEANLTLAGWQEYEEEKRGRASGSYGFIALQFGDNVLDPFLEENIKPAVATVGYKLVDMRDVKKAGVIDNLMRMQIRDAAFVLADLTHANNGAYWEAGYAEGLGKPVIYLCERSKFDKDKSHFDTNHCTTVMWETAAPDAFKADLIATLRNSLNLFANKDR